SVSRGHSRFRPPRTGHYPIPTSAAVPISGRSEDLPVSLGPDIVEDRGHQVVMPPHHVWWDGPIPTGVSRQQDIEWHIEHDRDRWPTEPGGERPKRRTGRPLEVGGVDDSEQP